MVKKIFWKFYHFIKFVLPILILCICYDVNALTYSQNVEYYNTISGADGELSTSIGLYSENNFNQVRYNVNKQIKCDNNLCLVSFNFGSSSTIAEYNSSGFFILENQIISVYAGTSFGTCSVSGNTIDCLYPNGSTLSTMYLTFTKLLTNSHNRPMTGSASINVVINQYQSIYTVLPNKEAAIQNQIIQQQNQQHQDSQATQNKIDNVNDTLNDSSTDDPSGSVSDWNSKTASNGTITDLITLPITLFTNILNNINGRCTTFNLGSLFGSDLRLPCINVANYVGSALWSVIDVLFSGLFVLVIGKKMIKIFNNFTMMKEGDVLD